MTIQPTTPASAVQQPPYVSVPSIVGPGQADLGLLSLGRLGRSGREQQPLAVDWGQGAYLVGAGTERYTRPLERMNLERLAEGADTRALTYAACASSAHHLPSSRACRALSRFSRAA